MPLRRLLGLLADGLGGAMVSWAGFTAEAERHGWWQERLDRAFISRHLGKQ